MARRTSSIERLVQPARPILAFVAGIWIVSLINLRSDLGLDRISGIVPRTLKGLVGIGAAPFIHANEQHLLANTVPLLVLGTIVGVHNARRFWTISAAIVILGGLGVWLFGRPASHIGASGLLFGYFGYLITQGFYARSLAELAAALLALFLYSGIVWGILPQDGTHSWEAHLFGLIAGIATARHNQAESG